MIFRQLFDSVSGTYSYLLASRAGGEALIIDPVLEKVDRYLQLIRELDLRLVKAVDTHLHADHITGLGALRDRTHCITVMGENTKADVVSMRLAEGDKLTIEGVSMDVLYTPGHTDDSYSFLMGDRVFTGDTLLIRGTGRTDFQNGDARAQYKSLFGKLLRLPDETLVFPGARLQRRHRLHHRRGEALQSAPAGQVDRRLCRADGQLASAQPEDDGRRGALQHENRHGAAGNRAPRLGAQRLTSAIALVGRPDIAFVDLREASERQKHGSIPGALHAPYGELQDNIGAGGILRELARASDRRLVFYCAFGERSAMAVQAAQDAGLIAALHVEGGLDAWKKAGGALAHSRTCSPGKRIRHIGERPSAPKLNALVQNLAEEQLGPLVLRMVEELLRRVDLDDLARVHEHDAVGDLAGEAHFVVTHSMVMPSSASSTMVSSTSLTISGSSAEVGSSNSMIFGFMHSARAIATRCCWPPDSWPGYFSACSGIFTRLR